MTAWLSPEPPADWCACGSRASFWDGDEGAAFCRPCLQRRTDEMAVAVLRHRGHAIATDGCVPCRNGMQR